MRAFFVLGVLPACAQWLAGCIAAPPRRADPTADGRVPRFVVIAGAPDSNWDTAKRGVDAAAKTLGAKIEWHAPTAKSPKGESPLTQQQKMVEAAGISEPDGVILAPIDATEMVPPVNKVGKKFLPLLVFGAPVYTKQVMTYVKNDDDVTGQLAARAAAKITGGKGRVSVLTATENLNVTRTADSFKATLKKEFPAIQVADVAANAATAGVLFAPDETTSRAALKTLSPQTKLIAFGNGTDLIAALRTKKISALVVPDRYQLAYQSVRALLDHYAHRPTGKEVEIAPVLITPEDLQSPKTQQLLGLETKLGR